MLPSCPRCGSPRVGVAASDSQLECRACGAAFAERPTLTQTVDGCQCVIWRQGDRRCELWVVGGVSHVRVYSGDQLDVELPFSRGHGAGQAEYLKSWQERREHPRKH